MSKQQGKKMCSWSGGPVAARALPWYNRQNG